MTKPYKLATTLSSSFSWNWGHSLSHTETHNCNVTDAFLMLIMFDTKRSRKHQCKVLCVRTQHCSTATTRDINIVANFDSFNTLSSKQKLQLVLKSWSYFSWGSVWCKKKIAEKNSSYNILKWWENWSDHLFDTIWHLATTWLLCCSDINNMAFVFIRHQQHDFYFFTKSIESSEWLTDKARQLLDLGTIKIGILRKYSELIILIIFNWQRR